jgi:hypothetical protein
LKDRWKYLRDQYTKFKKITNEGKPKWKYFGLMDFLSDHIEHSETVGNVGKVNKSSEL